jgi:hypothetical protein
MDVHPIKNGIIIGIDPYPNIHTRIYANQNEVYPKPRCLTHIVDRCFQQPSPTFTYLTMANPILVRVHPIAIK